MKQEVINAFSQSDSSRIAEEGTSGTPAEPQRILIVSHSYIPTLSPRVFRWSALAEHWANEGRQVDVVTSCVAEAPDEETLNRVRVYRCGGGVIEKMRSRFRPSERSTIVDPARNEYVGGAFAQPMRFPMRSSLNSAIRMAHNASWKQLYWPDYACLWINPAVGKIRELAAANEYDSLITVSDPFSSHVAGMRARPYLGDCAWLVDIGDPFCFRTDTPPNNQSLYSRLNYKTEEKLFTQADIVSVTTDTTMTKYAELFPDQKSKITVIPPLMTDIEPEFSERTGETTLAATSTSPNRLVFLGTLYKAIRNPEYLLKLFSALADRKRERELQLHFYGGYDECQDYFRPYERRLGQSVFLHGLVSKREALRAMNSAEFLINIGNDNSYQLPSKVIEYACTGKPIVNLSHRDDDCSAEFLSDYPAALTLNTSGSASLDDQVSLLDNFITIPPGKPSSDYMTDLRNEYSATAIAKMYQACILRSGSKEAAV